jgi:hypothetical protein
MRQLFFAAIASLTVAVGTVAFASAASAESSDGYQSKTNLSPVIMWGPAYGSYVNGG